MREAEAVGYEGRAAHGSVVGAAIRGWHGPGVIEAGWKVSEILLSQQNLPTLGTPEEPSSLRHMFSTSTAAGMNELRCATAHSCGERYRALLAVTVAELLCSVSNLADNQSP